MRIDLLGAVSALIDPLGVLDKIPLEPVSVGLLGVAASLWTVMPSAVPFGVQAMVERLLATLK
jgi:hypothetical protein